MLIAPCTNAQHKVEVYLPEGDWLRFPCGTLVKGHQVLSLTLSLDEMAVFVKAGHKIPIGEAVEHTHALVSDYQDTNQLAQWPQSDFSYQSHISQ